MFSLEDSLIYLLLGALVILLFSMRPFIKKLRRKVRKRIYGTIASSKGLLLVLLLFGGNSDVSEVLQYTPAGFQTSLLASHYDIDYSDSTIHFTSNRGVNGTVGMHNNKVLLSLIITLSTPKSLETAKELAQSFTVTSALTRQMDELIRKKGNRRIQIEDGYLEVKDGVMYLQVERVLKGSMI
jgi:hypothetical protein